MVHLRGRVPATGKKDTMTELWLLPLDTADAMIIEDLSKHSLNSISLAEESQINCRKVLVDSIHANNYQEESYVLIVHSGPPQARNKTIKIP